MLSNKLNIDFIGKQKFNIKKETSFMKKRTRNLKLISFVMSLILVLLVFPLSSIAYALENRYETLNEVVELRDENTKHFENPDGSYTAIMYNNAVHRKDSNGNWQDIDNTMSETEIKNKQAYITSDGRITFAKKIKQDENEIYTLSENGYRITVSFANENIKSSNAKLSNHASKYTPSGRDDLDTQFKKVKQIDNNTTLLYKNTLKGIDLEYVLSSNNVKENIIVKRLQDEYSYTFIYSLENLVATLNEDGSVSLFDSESGEERYLIPVPYMYDANGNLSYDVEYSLESLENGDYALTVSANSDWISSAELPVVIDPTTVTTVSNSACVYDTYIDVNNPNTNYGNNRNMYVSSSQMVYMRPVSLPTIPDDATVFYATLNIYYYYPSAVPEDGVELDVYPVVVPWSENTWTYSTASQYDFLGLESRDLGYAYLPESYTSSQDFPEFAPIDITGIFVNAYAGEPFYGMALTYSSDEYPSYISILSGETYLTTYSTYDLYYQRDAVLEEDSKYYFRNVEHTAGYMQLDDNGGNFAELYEFKGTMDQKWDVEYLHNGYYKITSASTGLALSSPAGKEATANQKLLLESYNVLDRQQWDIIDVGNGMYKISPRTNNSFYVAAGATLAVNGTNIEQRKEKSNGKDEWYFAKIEYESNVALEAQQMSNWCWAAVARMFAKHFYSSVSYTQEQAVSYVKGSVVDEGGTVIQAQSAINYYISSISGAIINTRYTAGNVYTAERLADFLDMGTVVFAGWSYYRFMNDSFVQIPNGHAVLIYGYVTIGSSYHFLIKDPSPQGTGSIYMLHYDDLYFGETTDNDMATHRAWQGSVVKDTYFANETIPSYQP